MKKNADVFFCLTKKAYICTLETVYYAKWFGN